MRAGSTIIKLIILSLIVGFILMKLDITPEHVLNYLGDTVVGIFDWLIKNAGEAMAYVITGAAVVIPIWLIFAVLKYMRSGPSRN